MQTTVYDRQSGESYVEDGYKSRQLEFLYNSAAGGVILAAVKSKAFSRAASLWYNSSASAKNINQFIERYNIDMSKYEMRRYTSFNDFFTRKMAEKYLNERFYPDELISVASSKLAVYDISENERIPVKGITYTVSELLGNVAQGYEGGTCLVFRLTADDYHRYCFGATGKITVVEDIKGCLHTVRDFSGGRVHALAENHRKLCVISSSYAGDVVQMEVGAMLIGKIKNDGNNGFACKGAQKGWFEYGGSTCLLFFKRGAVEIDTDIAENSARGIETKVKYAERIGKIKC